MTKTGKQIFVATAAALIFIAYFIYCLCTQAVITSDDLTLFNPVYNYLNTGHLTYQVYGEPGIITVHPPVHYYTVAIAMQIGLNAQQAFAFPFLAALLLVLVTVVTGKFSFQQKTAVLLALQCLYMFPLASIRPDCTLAMVWLASLLWFQWASEKNFSKTLLFIVGVLTAYSSTLHYYAVFANLAFPVYVYYIFSYHEKKEAIQKSVVLTFGFLVVLLPYYFLFVLPHIKQILQHVALNMASAGTVSAIQRHADYYEQFAGYFQENFFLSPLISLLFGCYTFHIPLVGCVILFLLFNRHRQIVFSALPMLLVIWLVSRSKSEGYFMPEYLLFIYLLVVFLLSIMPSCKVVRYAIYTWMAGAVLLTGAIVLTQSGGDFSFRNNSMQSIRAAVQKNLNGKTFVAGVISGWYISGSTTWRDVSMEMNTATLPPRDSLLRFFNRFDAIVQTTHMADFAANEQKKGVHSLYLDSLLHLKTFVLSNNGGYTSELACLLFSVEKPQRISGVLSRDNRQTSFIEEDSSGSFIFIAFQAPSAPNLLSLLGLNEEKMMAANFFFLPEKQVMQYDYRSRQAKKCLAFMLLKKEDFYLNRNRFSKYTQVRDMVLCSLHPAETLNDEPVKKYLLTGQ